MRPIDADALYSKLHSIGGCDAKDEWAKGYDDGVSAAIDCLQDAPTLDVAPVVRCEKCKHAHRTGAKDVYFCDVFECECTHDFYCKDGADNGT